MTFLNYKNKISSLEGNEKAIEKYFNVLDLSEEIGDRHSMSASYANIGNVYSALGSYSKVLEYYLKALKVRRLIRDDFDKAFADCDVIAGPTAPTCAFTL